MHGPPRNIMMRAPKLRWQTSSRLTAQDTATPVLRAGRESGTVGLRQRRLVT